MYLKLKNDKILNLKLKNDKFLCLKLKNLKKRNKILSKKLSKSEKIIDFDGKKNIK